MDPLDTLFAYKDTTLLLIAAAIKADYEIMVFTPNAWFWKDNAFFANFKDIRLLDAENSNWEVGKTFKILPLNNFDIILMRQNPPVNTEYLYASYALEWAENKGTIISNSPAGVRACNEKLAIVNFPSVITPTLISSAKDKLREFWEEQQEVVFKPLNNYGGEKVFFIGKDRKNLNGIIELLTSQGKETIMAQRYIPQITTTGDKRIIMIHGKAVPYALARIPAKNDWRGNLAQGAQGKVVPLTKRDQEIANTVADFVVAEGLHFVGLDIIGDYLTEMNVTSPTCLCEIQKATSLNIAAEYWQGFSK